MIEFVYFIIVLAILVCIAYLLLKYPNLAEQFDNPSPAPEMHTPNLSLDSKKMGPTNFMEAMSQMMAAGQSDTSRTNPKDALESIS